MKKGLLLKVGGGFLAVALIGGALSDGKSDEVTNKLNDDKQTQKFEVEDKVRKEKEEKERKRKQEAEKKAKSEAEKKAKEETEKKAKEEATRKEAERKAQEEAARQEMLRQQEAQRKAQIQQQQAVQQQQQQAPAQVYYANCAEARAAGAAPIYQGQPGYRLALDRDRDGIACDK